MKVGITCGEKGGRMSEGHHDKTPDEVSREGQSCEGSKGKDEKLEHVEEKGSQWRGLLLWSEGLALWVQWVRHISEEEATEIKV